MHDAWEASLKAPSTKIENIRNLRAKVLYQFKNEANFKLLISFSSGKGLFYRCLFKLLISFSSGKGLFHRCSFNNLILKVWFCLLSTLSCCLVTMQMMQNTSYTSVAKTQQKSSLVFLFFFLPRRKVPLFIKTSKDAKQNYSLKFWRRLNILQLRDNLQPLFIKTKRVCPKIYLLLFMKYF